MAKFHWWDDLRSAMSANPNKLVVIDKRPDGAVMNPNLNNGQRFTTIEQLKTYVLLDELTGPGMNSNGGTYDAAPDGSWVWEIIGYVVHTTANIMWAYFIEENGDFNQEPMFVVCSWPNAGTIDPAGIMLKPDYGPQPQSGVAQFKTATQNPGEFNFTFSNDGGYIGSNRKGPFTIWPLIAASPYGTQAHGTMGAANLGPWGGTKYDEASPIYMRRKKNSGGTTPPPVDPPPTGSEMYIESFVNGVSYGRIRFLSQPTTDSYIKLVDGSGAGYGYASFE